MAKYQVELQKDHLLKLVSTARPIDAIAELVWNALDADAEFVEVIVQPGALTTIERIVVSDNGTGMNRDEAIATFTRLGGSWKRAATRTRELKRQLHGRFGKGRFAAFALGDHVSWETAYRSGDTLHEFNIVGTAEDIATFDVSEEIESPRQRPGTVVTVSDMRRNFPSLFGRKPMQDLGEEFALHLQSYPSIRIALNNALVDPSAFIEFRSRVELPPIVLEDDTEHDAVLDIIEWNTGRLPQILFCDENGMTLHRLAAPPIRDFSYSAFVCSPVIRQWDTAGILAAADLSPEFEHLRESVKGALKLHFKSRKSASARNVVEDWKKREVYPFKGEPVSKLEEAERQLFDVVALNVHEELPDFGSQDPRAQRLSLQLLRNALEQGPEALKTILAEVLLLPKEKQEELAHILENTSLTAVIEASKVVADRLTFIAALELLVFDPELKKVVLERQHLHKILETQTWIFGEAFNLSVSDKSLDQVLQKHISCLGREDLAPRSPVRKEDGSIAIIDLMLSRNVHQPRAEEREHLIVELKRPGKQLGQTEFVQIMEYAEAVANDEQFIGTTTQWHFWLIGNNISRQLSMQAMAPDRPRGVVHIGDNMRVWVKTWSQIINDAKARLHFFKESLDYEATTEGAMEHLRSVYAKYLPEEFTE